MEQMVPIEDDGKQYYVSWKGHTVKLAEAEQAWVAKQAKVVLTEMRSAFMAKHVCESCAHSMRKGMTRDELNNHLRRAFEAKFVGKSIGKM
jgi:hypothetical protein